MPARLLAIFLLLCAAPAEAANYFITIERVDLKKREAEFVTVIEPDLRVDLLSAAPSVSFFNNGGRIPAGEYENFRVVFDDGGTQRTITRSLDYSEPLIVKPGSFVRVEFALELERNAAGTPMRPEAVKELQLTVDEAMRIENGDTLAF